MTDCYITLGFRWLDGENDMKTWQTFSRLLKDRSGNFGMMTAIMLPVLLGAGGMALDVTNMMISKSQLQDAADAASLAASTALANGQAANEQEARELAREFFIGQVANHMGSETAEAIGNATDIDVTTTTNQNGKGFEVRVGTNYELALTPLMGVLGYETTNVGANSVSKSGTSNTRSALSMTLVLDESGSMLADTNTQTATWKSCTHYNNSGYNIGWYAPCHIKKIEALESAANLLLDQLDEADPNTEFVRTSAINWSSEVQEASELAWGTSNTRNQVVKKLSGGGGTESSAPMKKAYEGLTKKNKKSEEHIHSQEKGNDTIQKYIVFMTDGNNNKASSDTATLKTCAAAKEAKITIYSIAFMAPSGGQNLLKACATDIGHYYEAESMQDLLSAFKAIGKKAAQDRTLLTN